MPRPRWLPAVPHIHFMAAAPLDAWARLLLTPGARISWRYWPRVGVNLVLSACVTAITLPERALLAPVLWWWGRRSRWRLRPPACVAAPREERRGATIDREGSGARPPPQPSPSSAAPRQESGGGPPALVILGYYRSGTTHLHNLLACDPASHTPRWGQVLSPQGFVLSWFVLKLFLWAVLPTKRPQDDMAFGPEWPGEDDFALSNWTLSSPLAGRVILPDCYEHFARYNDLTSLTPRERARWQRTQWAILFKVRLLARGRRLLLKTPPHTAKVHAIADVLGGPGRVKFIHLSRDPAAVLKSNQRLMKSMAPMHLQDAPPDDAIRDRLLADYELNERCYLQAEPSIPAGDIVRIRYEDLIADPLAELDRAYGALGLEFTPRYARRLGAYLDSVRAYRSETQKLAEPASPRTTPTPLPPALGWIAREFGHDQPTRPPAPESLAPRVTPTPVHAALVTAGPMLLAAVLMLGLWQLVATQSGHRSAIFAMLAGITIGLLGTARSGGTLRRGILAAALSLGVAMLGMLLATRSVDLRNAVAPSGGDHPPALLAAWWRRFTHESTLLWTALGVLAAFRLGSRRFGVVPGARGGPTGALAR